MIPEELKQYTRKFQGYEPINGEWQHLTVIPEDWAGVSYGDIKEDLNGQYIEVPYCTHSDYSGGTVELSNFNSITKKFEEFSGRGIWNMYGGFGTKGLIISIEFYENNTDIQEVINDLFNYPVFDEDDLYKTEYNLEQDAWDGWIKFDLIRMLESEGLKYNEKNLHEKFDRVMNDNSIEYIHEDTGWPYVRLEEVIKHW